MRAAGRVAIGVCTAHRPEMLRCCLAALASQIVPEGCKVRADNDAAQHTPAETDKDKLRNAYRAASDAHPKARTDSSTDTAAEHERRRGERGQNRTEGRHRPRNRER